MESGQLIKVRAYGGHELIRKVIRIEKNKVIVCRPEEYDNAMLQGREPIGVGFNISDITKTDETNITTTV